MLCYRGWACDGNNDCGDNSDESDNKCNDLVCTPNQFMCSNKEKCIPDKWTCDFDEDCSDGSDEENCDNKKCQADQFRCRNGQCISKNWVCDLENDCQDGSDEDNCGGPVAEDCKPNEFRCPNSPQCLPKSWKCDGD
jgi:hypothetical protein